MSFYCSLYAAPPAYFNVKDFGAVGDGKMLCTNAFQKAVDACARAGGGRLVFPAGKYLSGPIFLKSNCHLEIEAGAILLFDNKIKQTPLIEGSWEGIERKVYASLFTGVNLENITISGRGTLDGQGQAWWDAYRLTEVLRKKMNIVEREQENPQGSALPYPRPRVINLYHCKNILIRDITILNSPSWTIHPVYCENISIQRISIVTPYGSPNTDGINPESCKNVRILDCFIDCGDDCITLKSGYNERGRKIGIPCEDIIIANCVFAHGRSAIGIGSEMSGGIRNVTVTNCVFNGTLRGIRIKTARGRGAVVENVIISGIVMDNISEGISLDMYYDARNEDPEPVTEKTPSFRNIRISNISGTHVDQAMNLSGLPESPLQDIRFDHIYFNAIEGVKCRFAQGIHFTDCEINAEKGNAFFIRKSSGILLENVGSRRPQAGTAVMQIESSDGLVVRDCLAEKNTEIMVKTMDTKNMDFINNLPGKALIIKNEVR
jgi:polygalacturonase